MKVLCLLLLLGTAAAHAQTAPNWSSGYVPGVVTTVTPGTIPPVGGGSWVDWFGSKADYDSVATGQFFENEGAHVQRFGDRVFVGNATVNLGQSDRAASAQDWLSTIMNTTSVGPWPMWETTLASETTVGGISILGASQSALAVTNKSVFNSTPPSIGVAAWGIANDTSSANLPAWALYGEAWGMPGAGGQAFGLETDGVNLRTAAHTPPNPFTINVGQEVSNFQTACGGGQTASTIGPCDVAYKILNNGQPFAKGLVIGAAALSGTNGTDSGYAEAIELGRNQAIEWDTPENTSSVQGANIGGYIRSIVDQAIDENRIEFQDVGTVFLNENGLPLFTVTVAPGNGPGVASSLNVQSGTTTSPPTLANQVTASGGDPDINLTPASGGIVRITGGSLSAPAFAAGTAPGVTCAAGSVSLSTLTITDGIVTHC